MYIRPQESFDPWAKIGEHEEEEFEPLAGDLEEEVVPFEVEEAFTGPEP